MNQSGTPKIESYLEQYGWSYVSNLKGIVYSGWASDYRSYPLKILIEDSFITLQIQPFVRTDFDVTAWPEIAAFLLEVNYHSHLAKLCIDDAGDIVLCLTMLSAELTYSAFSSSLGILAKFADDAYEDIKKVLEQLEPLGVS